ncbi:MAG: hypothetical protein SOV63_07245 [Pyramidobacter porci]|nr:hypothetical protein [Pyramidobacter porci]MDY2648588.1 hypothetical protein [Pyramidobacter porci]
MQGSLPILIFNEKASLIENAAPQKACGTRFHAVFGVPSAL